MPSLILDPLDGTPPLALDWQAGYLPLPGPLGLEMAPRALVTNRRLVGDGLDVERVVVGARDVTVPLHVWGEDRADYLAKRRRLQAIIGRRQPVRLTHVEDDGQELWLAGHYIGGMEGDGSERAGGNTWQNYAAVFRCGNPFWHMPEQVVTWGLATPGSWFPFPPLRLSASTIKGRLTVINPGDVDVLPRWEVTGPGTRLDVIHHDTGRSITLVTNIGDGQVVTIDTRPGFRSVTDTDGADLMGAVESDPEFFPLLAGANDVEVQLMAAGDAARVVLTYEPLREST